MSASTSVLSCRTAGGGRRGVFPFFFLLVPSSRLRGAFWTRDETRVRGPSEWNPRSCIFIGHGNRAVYSNVNRAPLCGLMNPWVRCRSHSANHDTNIGNFRSVTRRAFEKGLRSLPLRILSSTPLPCSGHVSCSEGGSDGTERIGKGGSSGFDVGGG